MWRDCEQFYECMYAFLLLFYLCSNKHHLKKLMEYFKMDSSILEKVFLFCEAIKGIALAWIYRNIFLDNLFLDKMCYLLFHTRIFDMPCFLENPLPPPSNFVGKYMFFSA